MWSRIESGHMGESSTERHSDDEYITAVRENEPAATSEIAEAIGVARQSADYRLRKLEEDGFVKGKMVGNSLAWSVTNDES